MRKVAFQQRRSCIRIYQHRFSVHLKMAATSAARSLQAIKPHLPLIKFRKGGPLKNDSHAPIAQKVPQSSQSSSNAMEDSQLPPKYARKPISDIEIAYIMRGGPE